MKELLAAYKSRAGLEGVLKSIDALKEDPNAVEKLLAVLRGAFETTLVGITIMARAVRCLEEVDKDFDFEGLNISILPTLRKIGNDQVIPELMFHVRGQRLLLARASNLPKLDQQRVADDEPMKVVELGGGHRMIPPSKMTRLEIYQVFAGDHIRNDAEQAAWRRDREQRQPKRAVANDNGVVLEPAHNRIRVTGEGVVLTLHDLLEYAARLSDLKNKGK